MSLYLKGSLVGGVVGRPSDPNQIVISAYTNARCAELTGIYANHVLEFKFSARVLVFQGWLDTVDCREVCEYKKTGGSRPSLPGP